ncbi:hypothetical protein JS44_14660, partial [Anoxybacillus flavithermus]
MGANFERMIQEYRGDMESVYQTWFIDNDQRLKAFRTIRNGVIEVIKDIENNTFGNDFKGSTLEIVVTAIAEQNKFLKEPPTRFIGSRNFEYRIFVNWASLLILLLCPLMMLFCMRGHKHHKHHDHHDHHDHHSSNHHSIKELQDQITKLQTDNER